jgi:hypothetical protein
VKEVEIDHDNRRSGKDRRNKERRSGAERRLANQN